MFIFNFILSGLNLYNYQTNPVGETRWSTNTSHNKLLWLRWL